MRTARDFATSFATCKAASITSPISIARPRTEQDVIDLLDWCSANSIAVIPYGGGSSVVGGIEPRFDGPGSHAGHHRHRRGHSRSTTPAARPASKPVFLDPSSKTSFVPHGLTLRHFPQSFGFSTLGGWLATRCRWPLRHALHPHRRSDRVDAGRHSGRCLRIATITGVGRRSVTGSAVPGLGGNPRRHHRGLDAPPAPSTLAGHRFGHLRPLPAGGRRHPPIAQAGLYPANCRLLDPAEAFLNADTAVAGGLLVLAFESADHPVDTWMERALEITAEHGGTTIARRGRDGTAPDAATNWRSAFLRMPYQRDALARRSLIVETFETACTWDNFRDIPRRNHLDRAAGDHRGLRDKGW